MIRRGGRRGARVGVVMGLLFVALLGMGGSGIAQPVASPPGWSPERATGEPWRFGGTDPLPPQPAMKSNAGVCTGTDTVWSALRRDAGVELQVQTCPSSADAAYLVAAYDADEARQAPAIFGDDVDTVTAVDGVPTSCGLARRWAQGNRALSMVTVSRSLSADSCRRLNEQLSRDLVTQGPDLPERRGDIAGDRFSDVLALPSQLVGLFGLTVFIRWCFRARWPLSSQPATFTDVTGAAVRLVWCSRAWAMLRALRISAVAAVLVVVLAGLIGTMRVVSTVLVVVGLVLVFWLLDALMKRIDRDRRAAGADPPRSPLTRPRAGVVLGWAVRLVARSTVVLVGVLWIATAAGRAVGVAHGELLRTAATRLSRVPWSAFTVRDAATFTILLLNRTSLLLLLLVAVAVVGGARLLDRIGVALLTAPLEEVLDSLAPDVPYVLYLRCFGDDGIRMAASSQLVDRGVLFEFSLLRRVRFEELFVRRVGRRAPVVALADPHASMSVLGSARTNVPVGAHWQHVVHRLGQGALAIVVSAAPTAVNQGLIEELEMISRGLGQGRLLLVLPPASQKTLRARWATFRQAAAPHHLFDGVDAAVAGGAAQVIACIDGRWHGWGARTRTEASYSASLDAALEAALPVWTAEATYRL